MTQRESDGFYPPTEPYRTGRLRVSDLHELYNEECGNHTGKPIVFLHGGPGAGLIPVYRRAFDPERYRIVLFDQRGAGRSTPKANFARTPRGTSSPTSNGRARTSASIVGRWPRSWGGTLAVHMQTHPDQVPK
jgi:proline iminopeptidase